MLAMSFAYIYIVDQYSAVRSTIACGAGIIKVFVRPASAMLDYECHAYETWPGLCSQPMYEAWLYLGDHSLGGLVEDECSVLGCWSLHDKSVLKGLRIQLVTAMVSVSPKYLHSVVSVRNSGTC